MELTTTQRAIRAAVEARAVHDSRSATDLLNEYAGLADPQDIAAVRQTLDNTGLRYLIWSYEHLAWWAPHRHGYVANPAAAGRYHLADAACIVTDANWWMPPDVLPHEVMVLAPECWLDRLNVPDPLAWRLAVATAELMCERGFNGWEARR